MTEKSKASSVSKRRAPGPRAKGEARANAVYFSSLTIENTRCFGPPQRLNLADEKGHPAQWTVLLGDNGVGKTTLLQCLVGLEPFDLVQGQRDKPWIVARAAYPSSFTESEYFRFHADGNASVTAEICWGKKIAQNRGNIHREELSFQIEHRAEGLFLSSAIIESKEILGLECYAYGASMSMV